LVVSAPGKYICIVTPLMHLHWTSADCLRIQPCIDERLRPVLTRMVKAVQLLNENKQKGLTDTNWKTLREYLSYLHMGEPGEIIRSLAGPREKDTAIQSVERSKYANCCPFYLHF
jgi:hypothetical protein